jgi:LuxR family maltose regulon positive regulatory protein
MERVAAKLLIPPSRPGRVVRKRLLSQFHAALDRPLTLVTAPPGFGKTTAVSSWLAQVRARVAWLTLDDHDDVLDRFLDYLFAAVAALNEPAAAAGRSLLESSGQSASAPGMVAALVNDLMDVDDELILVLDDFHLINDTEILDAVTFLVDHCPPRLHVILLSRREPLLPLARWRAAGLVGEIGTAQLRFTADEAAALVHSIAGAAVGRDIATQLQRRAEGWAVGLQLFAIGLRDGTAPSPPSGAVTFRLGDRYVFDYLAEVLRGQPADVQEFLHATAVLDAFTPALCDAMLDRHDSAEKIEHLERANMLLEPLDNRGHWHRYHSLLAEHLRTELDPAQAREAHRRAAAWYAEHGFPDDTIRHSVAAGETALAVRTVRSVVDDHVRRGELAAVLGWLNRLPDAVVRSHGDLAGFKGWLLYLAGRQDDAETYAAIADAQMDDDSPPADRAMLRTFQAYLALTHGEPHQADMLAEGALDLLGESTSFFRAAAMGALGQARRLAGDRRGAIEVLRAAVRLGERSGNPLSALEATGYLAPLLYVQGRLREAVVLCEEAVRRQTEASGPSAPMVGLVEVPLGTLLYERDELDGAKQHLVDGIARCEQMGTTSYTLLGLRTLGRLDVAQGAVDDGFRALLAAGRQADAAEDHRRARLVIATTAELHLRTGNTAAAEDTIHELGAEQRSTSDYEQLTRARLEIARGRPSAALNRLAVLDQRALPEGRNGSRVAILVLIARAQAALHNHDAARAVLAEALQLAAGDGYRRTFLDEGPALLGLLRDARSSAPSFVADLLTRFRGSAAPLPAAMHTPDHGGVIQPLTDTQRRILSLIGTGMSNRQVADELFITVGTTKWHLNQIYGRLQARNRTEAVARARELQLL